MRLVTEEPEFSWTGTIFIVLAFTLAALGHAVAWAARQRGARRRWTTPARFVGGVLTMALFGGAGAVMLPTVVGASLARWRGDWRRSARVVAALAATPVPLGLVVDLVDAGVTAGRLLGLLLIVGTYSVVVTTTRWVVEPIADGWRLPRAVRIGLSVLGLVAVAAFTILLARALV
jgi:hypothetical protein